MIAQDTINALNAIPLPQVFDRYGIEWAEGRNFKRPWGDTATGRTPSCKYYPQTNTFGDFGTHKGGGPVRFVMLMDNLSFPAACKKLAGMFGIQGTFDFDPEYYAKMQANKASAREEKERLYALECRYSLLSEAVSENPELAENLGILMLALKLTESEYDYMGMISDAENVTLDSIEGAKDVLRGYADRLKNASPDTYSPSRGSRIPLAGIEEKHLLIPILYPSLGTMLPLGFNSRALDPGDIRKYKYESLFTKSELVWGIDKAFIKGADTQPVILTEGIYDSVRLKQLGFSTAVTPLSARLSKMHYYQLAPFAKNGFIFAFDGDSGGYSAEVGTRKVLENRKCICTGINIAQGEDPDSEGRLNPHGLVLKIQSGMNILQQAQG